MQHSTLGKKVSNILCAYFTFRKYWFFINYQASDKTQLYQVPKTGPQTIDKRDKQHETRNKIQCTENAFIFMSMGSDTKCQRTLRQLINISMPILIWTRYLIRQCTWDMRQVVSKNWRKQSTAAILHAVSRSCICLLDLSQNKTKLSCCTLFLHLYSALATKIQGLHVDIIHRVLIWMGMYYVPHRS